MNLVGESWFASLQVEEKTGILNETNLSAQHYRIAIDGSHKISFEHGATITPTLSIGLLHNGKDQNALRGIEFGNGLSYSDPIGLELAGNARMILEQTSQARLWNLNGTINYDYGKDKLGPIFTATGNYVQAPNNYSELLNISIIDSTRSSSMENSINTELQYGFSICGNKCILTPFAGFELDEEGLKQSQFGTQMTISSFMNIEFEHSYSSNAEDSTNQRVQLNSKFSWWLQFSQHN